MPLKNNIATVSESPLVKKEIEHTSPLQKEEAVLQSWGNKFKNSITKLLHIPTKAEVKESTLPEKPTPIDYGVLQKRIEEVKEQENKAELSQKVDVAQIEHAFFQPISEEDKLISFMLHERMYEKSKNQVEAERVSVLTKKSGWFSKLTSAVKIGMTNNFTNKKVIEVKNQLLYADKSQKSLSSEAVRMYQEIQEQVCLASSSDTSSSKAKIAQAVVEQSKRDLGSSKKWKILGRFDKLGVIENMKKRFALKSDLSIKKDHLSSGVQVGGTAVAALGITGSLFAMRSALKSIPLIGAALGGGILGTKNVHTKTKGMDEFLSYFLSGTVLEGVRKFASKDEVEAVLLKNSPKGAGDQAKGLALVEKLLTHALEKGMVDNGANMQAFLTLMTHVSELIQKYGRVEEDIALYADFKKKEKSIKWNARKKMVLGGIIGSVAGAGAAGVMMGIGAGIGGISKNIHTNTGGQPANMTQSNETGFVKPTSSNSVQSIVSSHAAEKLGSIHADEVRTYAGVEYNVFKANDGMHNFPVYALKDGTIPYNIEVAKDASLGMSEISRQAHDFDMDLTDITLRPRATNDFVAPIKFHVVSHEYALAHFKDQNAVTTFSYDKNSGMRITEVWCSPKTLKAEMYHAFHGITEETHDHVTGNVGGYEHDHEAMENMEEKRAALLSTNNENDEAMITSKASSHANEPDLLVDKSRMRAEYEMKLNQYTSLQKQIAESELKIKSAGYDMNRYNELTTTQEFLTKMKPGTFDQIEYLKAGYAQLLSRGNIGTSLLGSKGFSDFRADEAAKVVADLIAKGYDASTFSEHDAAMNAYYFEIRGASKGLLSTINTILDNDGSKPALKMKLKIHEELTSRGLISERYNLGVDREIKNSGLIDFHPSTEENVNLSRQYFREDLSNLYSVANDIKTLGEIDNKITLVNNDLRRFTGAESSYKSLMSIHKNQKASAASLYEELKDLRSRYVDSTKELTDITQSSKSLTDLDVLQDTGEKKVITTSHALSNKVTLNGNEFTVRDTGSKGISSVDYDKNTNRGEMTLDYTNGTQKTFGFKVDQGGKLTFGEEISTSKSQDTLPPLPDTIEEPISSTSKNPLSGQPNKDYAKMVPDKIDKSLSVDGVLALANENTSFSTLVNRMLATGEYNSLSSAQDQADKIIGDLRNYLEKTHKGSSLSRDFATKDAKELAAIQLGNNGLTLGQALIPENKEHTAKIFQMIVDSRDLDGMGVTNTEVKEAFDNPGKYWSMKNLGKWYDSTEFAKATWDNAPFMWVAKGLGAVALGGAALAATVGVLRAPGTWQHVGHVARTPFRWGRNLYNWVRNGIPTRGAAPAAPAAPAAGTGGTTP